MLCGFSILHILVIGFSLNNVFHATIAPHSPGWSKALLGFVFVYIFGYGLNNGCMADVDEYLWGLKFSQ